MDFLGLANSWGRSQRKRGTRTEGEREEGRETQRRKRTGGASGRVCVCVGGWAVGCGLVGFPGFYEEFRGWLVLLVLVGRVVIVIVEVIVVAVQVLNCC